MKCINCGNEVSSNELVCPYCGTSKSANQQNTSNNQNSNQQNAGGFCIMCGKAVPFGYKMCPECTSGQLAEKSMPEKKKSYAGIIVLLSLLILLVGAVAVGFGTGIIPEFISEFSVEDAEPANETKDDSETEKDKNSCPGSISEC